ncbi:MAG TPA: helix-turn-helix domain-containing protein, partial [Burkholderiales bacterium]|nr:helix-turn-helix domain-containing protein [Burkholderiales bacterium]
DNAGVEGKAWPSLVGLEQKTCLDRKTIVKALDWLEEIGLLLDTAERKGATKQVKVYRLNGLDAGERHYVYRVRHLATGEYYLGVRSTWGEPAHDDAYYGSGQWPIRMRREKQPLTKDILATFKERRHAEHYETEAILAVMADPLNRNEHSGSYPVSELLKSGENGTVPKVEQFQLSGGTVPFFPETVPKTEHGTQRTQKEPKVEGKGGSTPPPRRTRKEKDPTPTAATWEAYAAGFKKVHGVEPMRNARAMGLLSQVVARVGAENAPVVAGFFFTCRNPYYPKVKHDAAVLLADCEKLLVELRQQSGGGQRAPERAEVFFEGPSGTRNRLDTYPVGDPEAIAKIALRAYAQSLKRRGSLYLIVAIGAKEARYSLAELEATT